MERIGHRDLKDTSYKDLKVCRAKLIKLKSQMRYEELLRDENAGLRNAWEQYQLMLQLIKSK